MSDWILLKLCCREVRAAFRTGQEVYKIVSSAFKDTSKDVLGYIISDVT